jgi:phospholipid/cholesterol/gamma-HCH transport system substrate-binding protein
MGRIAGIALVILGAAAVAIVLLGSGGADYKVRADFQNASQLVKGDLVQVSGTPVGTVSDIALTRDGEAQVTMTLDKDYTPLRRGTKAVVRQASLSGIANRYIDLSLAPQRASSIPNEGIIGADDTTTAVDLDQLFNTFDPKTRRSLSKLIRGFATTYAGRGKQANAGFAYLNPTLAASARLFREINRDTPLLERFIVANSQLVSDVAERRDDLAGLVSNLADTTGALARQHTALAESINRLPAFMRRSNTTFVNLRATLDDLKPLVDASKPVAKKLRPFLRELRPFARDARPTLRDLSKTVSSPGANNDLIELTKGVIPLRDIAIGPVVRNGETREGAFPASTRALSDAAPELAYGRPYAVDLTGWFDDFSHSGLYDALGGASRAAPHINANTLINGVLTPVPVSMRGLLPGTVTGQNNRCPGSAEHAQPDGSVPFKPSPDYNCDPSQILPGN